VLNSGSLLLAYTFGLPVIAPATGCLVDLLDPGASIGFDPEDDDALLGALRRVRSLTGPTPRRAARAIAERYPPPDMAADFAALLRRLVG
jgi:glycosyltransferase involved in cell wall biosynthesis